MEAGADASTQHRQARHNRNRRLAFMQQLQRQGQHFSDQAMKERSPLLYHEHIGQYTGEGDVRHAAAVANADASSSGGGPGAAMRLSDALMAQHDAVMAHRRLHEEMDEDLAQKETSEEEEEEEEEENEGAGVQGAGSENVHHAGHSNGTHPSAAGQGQPASAPISAAALARKRQELIQEMESRFLQGLDPGIDYAAIDADTRLDEHWASQINQDAEDAYFRGEGSDEEGNANEGRRDEYDY